MRGSDGSRVYRRMSATTAIRAAQPSRGLRTLPEDSCCSGSCSARTDIQLQLLQRPCRKNLRVILRFLPCARVRASSARHYSVGQVAQLVEHMTENHGVGGSIPSLATSIFL